MAMALEPKKQRSDDSLVALVDRLLDKGLVINADILVSVAGVELLGIKVRAALASFETAAQYGLEFPSGTNYETAAWKQATVQKETCPQCDKRVDTKELMEEGCPWCGWVSAKAKNLSGQEPLQIKS
ncbi:MAG TPA: gas vesicle protein [Desulfosporosinus sp.]|nr:gas vesicle protein [Desulfosporosinus sp.]